MADAPLLAAQTALQDAHIEHDPHAHPPTSSPHHPHHPHPHPHHRRKHNYDSYGHTAPSVSDTASISSSILHRQSHLQSRRRHGSHHRAHLPPLPDLRFEQSYLASIAPAQGDVWKILMITVRDQVVFPLVQGTLFSLGLAGWRAWNGKARFYGKGLGAKVRRWWWEVNGWQVPEK